MKKLALSIVLFSLASPAWATTYYLATATAGGNDSNNGTSVSTPWLSPNHPVNCGDVILAASSSAYAWYNFDLNWGTVTCPAGNNVAWLKCVTFDACKIQSGAAGIYVDHSYWGVQGWEVNVSADNGGAGCFMAVPNYKTQVSVHHIIFANDVANGCYSGGFVTGESGTGSADYVAFIGNIAYNAAAGSSCYSNIDVFEPANVLDTLPGTHIYIAGNFSFGALNTPKCNGGFPASDGEGINVDSLNRSGGKTYTGQVVVDNNIVVANGGRGLEAEFNTVGSASGTIIFRQNTSWGNNQDITQTASVFVPEVGFYQSYNSQAYLNLVMPNEATLSGGSNLVFALMVLNGNGTDQMHGNFVYSAAGSNTNSTTSSGFSFGANATGSNPNFANATAPGAPSCSGFASVPACMAALIANFRPTNPVAAPYGYQVPGAVPTYDPLFPQWLCNVNLPAGLVTIGCLSQSSLPAGPRITGIQAH